jgi:hypothetical protein
MKTNEARPHLEPATAACSGAGLRSKPRRDSRAGRLNAKMHRGFPRPVRRVGRRPYWKPEDVVAWAQGGGR